MTQRQRKARPIELNGVAGISNRVTLRLPSITARVARTFIDIVDPKPGDGRITRHERIVGEILEPVVRRLQHMSPSDPVLVGSGGAGATTCSARARMESLMRAKRG